MSLKIQVYFKLLNVKCQVYVNAAFHLYFYNIFSSEL